MGYEALLGCSRTRRRKTIPHHTLLRGIPSLNSRTTLHSHGITVFNDGKQYGRNVFTHAHQRTAVEQWNVPRVVTDDLPAMINIEVSQELQIHKDHDLKRIVTSDS
ncbi:hypothetical protein C8Q78DRAFT_302397 [Trametes maxima]|nr:hypothetical protein C8Q78DRAFT_302397 [Trametes maxima]